MNCKSSTLSVGHFGCLAFLLFLLGCVSVSGKTELSVLKEKVKTGIRAGMTRQESMSVMNSLGFDCSFKTNETLRYYESHDAISKSIIENIDFLECRAKQQIDMVTEYLKVAIVIEEGAVARIIYVTEFSGP